MPYSYDDFQKDILNGIVLLQQLLPRQPQQENTPINPDLIPKEPPKVNITIKTSQPQLPNIQAPQLNPPTLTFADRMNQYKQLAQLDAFGRYYPAVQIASALTPAILAVLGGYLSGKAGLGVGMGAQAGAQAGALVPQTYTSVIQTRMQPYITEYLTELEMLKTLRQYMFELEKMRQQFGFEIAKMGEQYRYETQMRMGVEDIKGQYNLLRTKILADARNLGYILDFLSSMGDKELQEKLGLARLNLDRYRLGLEYGNDLSGLVRAVPNLINAVYTLNLIKQTYGNKLTSNLTPEQKQRYDEINNLIDSLSANTMMLLNTIFQQYSGNPDISKLRIFESGTTMKGGKNETQNQQQTTLPQLNTTPQQSTTPQQGSNSGLNWYDFLLLNNQTQGK
jgi:hypothetical protein